MARTGDNPSDRALGGLLLFDPLPFLREVTAAHGPSGREGDAARCIAAAFARYSGEVSVTPLCSVHARIGSSGPRVLLCAHSDEVALVVTDVTEDGFLRVHSNNGVDPRILPAHEVIVHGACGALPGVCGAKPPHLQTDEDRAKAVKMKDIAVDLGLPAEKVKQLVRVGDVVTLRGPLRELANGRIAGKTFDDRACVAVLLMVMDLLKNTSLSCEAHFVATSQEEVGSKGAWTSAHIVRPDIALALDVCHAPQPGAEPFDTTPFDKPSIAVGPNIHQTLYQRAVKVARDRGIDHAVDVCPGPTGTDGSSTQVAAGGVPTLVFQLPLRYMHTSVETIDQKAMARLAQWVAYFLQEVGAEEGAFWKY